MKFLTILIFVDAACLCRLQWIKLSLPPKELTVTESVIPVFTPIDQSFFHLSELISDKNIKSNVTKLSIDNYMEQWKNSSKFTDSNRVYINDSLDQNLSRTTNTYVDRVSLENFTSVITYFHQFMKKMPGTLPKKITLLQNIHDSILISINDRLAELWPRKQKREARGFKEHHTDFLSSEMALMTIGFLTFAVYLIKFVLQIINVLKAKKTMMFAPMVTGAGRSFSNNDIEYEKSTKIIELMESFNPMTS